MAEPLRLLINGAKGRMGTAIAHCATGDPQVVISGRASTAAECQAALADCELVIDFTHADATARLLEQCLAAGKPLVLGTTGHSAEGRAQIAQAARRLPIVFAPNFSIGVNTLFWLTQKTAEILGPAFDLEIVEMHHRLKKDAPSGTARRLAEILTEARELSYEDDVRHGRSGLLGERPAAEIGLHAIRGGDVIGDHTVIFAGAGERVELTHKATSRDTFASGSIQAAKWLFRRTPGLYSMQEVLGLGSLPASGICSAQ